MSDSFFCPIRRKWVAALPEELVRHHLIVEMIERLGYPPGTIILEKALHLLPHLQGVHSLPKRRADLIVLVKNLHPDHPFYPLLLIECKAVSLSEKTLRQIAGYNHYVGAPFIAAVNMTEAYTGWFDAEKKDFVFREGFLPYEILLQRGRSVFNPGA